MHILLNTVLLLIVVAGVCTRGGPTKTEESVSLDEDNVFDKDID